MARYAEEIERIYASLPGRRPHLVIAGNRRCRRASPSSASADWAERSAYGGEIAEWTAAKLRAVPGVNAFPDHAGFVRPMRARGR